MLPNQIPNAPVGMVMSPHYDVILAINFVVLAAVMVWIIKEARQTRSLTPVLLMVGAALASMSECIYDVMVLVQWADYGHTPLYRIFNLAVPIWMVAAYPWFIGGMGYWMYKQLKKGMTASQLWKLYFFAWAANLFLEVPALQLGNIYTYYGNQPFQILGFPLWMAWTNALMPILLGTVVYACEDVLVGARRLMIVFLVPMATGTAQIAVGWPIWLALNSGAGHGVTHAAALVTLCFSLMLVYLVSMKFCLQTQESRATAHIGAGARTAH
jgi:lipoprotein signal peptidase